jgi:hypothetical protein
MGQVAPEGTKGAYDFESDEHKRRTAMLEAIDGVLDLMRDSGTLRTHPDTIHPYCNGYSTWFITMRDGHWDGTFPLDAQEILRRIEARKALG